MPEEMGDMLIDCACGDQFVFTQNDQEFYEQKGYAKPMCFLMASREEKREVRRQEKLI